jgi:hypothetical protein
MVYHELAAIEHNKSNYFTLSVHLDRSQAKAEGIGMQND